MNKRHIPVMLEEVLNCWVNTNSRALYFVDGTVGLGGHSEVLLKRYPKANLLCIDRDPKMLMDAEKRLSPFKSRVTFRQGSYQDLSSHLTDTPDGILLDLGANSYQFDSPDRGFSFRHDGPLDMRYDQSDLSINTAADLVNHSSEVQLTNIFSKYGQEPFAKEAAKAIVRRRNRGQHPFETTRELSECLESVLVRWKTAPRKKGKIHPATLCFQALRIAVNQELDHVEKGLQVAIESLGPSGRLAVIAFHSLEDKLVKQYFRTQAQENEHYKLVPKRAMKPTEGECTSNPRARSARLRCLERL